MVRITPISKAYFWVQFEGTQKSFLDKFMHNDHYAFQFDPETSQWWLLYADIGSIKWEKAGEIFGDHGLEQDLPKRYRP